MILTPEQNKLLAEKMGYEVENRGTRGIEIIECDENGVSHVGWFNPAENPAQREEILLWLGSKGWEYMQLNGVHFFDDRTVPKGGKNSSVNSKEYTKALLLTAAASSI